MLQSTNSVAQTMHTHATGAAGEAVVVHQTRESKYQDIDEENDKLRVPEQIETYNETARQARRTTK